MTKPNINVTPLIDVLLVLLIIFMVVTPLKPSSFKTRIPSEQRANDPGKTNPKTLVVMIGEDSSIRLNDGSGKGTVDDSGALISRLKEIFADRIENGDVSDSFADSADRPMTDRIERAVFIKAPRAIGYGRVARAVDAVKVAGAFPISLQIDDLN